MHALSSAMEPARRVQVSQLGLHPAKCGGQGGKQRFLDRLWPQLLALEPFQTATDCSIDKDLGAPAGVCTDDPSPAPPETCLLVGFSLGWDLEVYSGFPPSCTLLSPLLGARPPSVILAALQD